MAVTYLNDDGMVREVVDRVISEYFDELATLDTPVAIDIRMAVSEDPDEPAVKLRGHPCAATIELIRPKEKSRTGLDARLTVDKKLWLDGDDEENIALIWHEIRHLEPIYDKHGILKHDAYKRPKLKLRLDDWMLTGFRECVRIFGEKSGEMRSLRRVQEMLRQQELPFEAERPAANAEIVREAFAALVSVGHAERQARDAIDGVLATGRRFESVADLIEAVHAAHTGAGSVDRVGIPAVPASVSFSGDDLDKVAAAGKASRKKAAMSPRP